MLPFSIAVGPDEQSLCSSGLLRNIPRYPLLVLEKCKSIVMVFGPSECTGSTVSIIRASNKRSGGHDFQLLYSGSKSCSFRCPRTLVIITEQRPQGGAKVNWNS